MEIREVKHRIQCRCCGKIIEGGENRLQHVTIGSTLSICMNCVEEIHDMFEHEYLEHPIK